MLEVNKIHHWDCLELMKQIPDNTIDLVVTSPPYDNLRDYNWYTFDFESIAHELLRVCKEGGTVVRIIWDAIIKGSESGSSFKQALFFKEIGFNLHDTMIREKPHFSNPSSNRYHQIFEYMFILTKGKIKTFNPICDVPIKYGKPVGKSSTRKKDWSIVNSEVKSHSKDFGARKNVWKINTAGQENFWKKVLHPAQFSKQIAKDHVISWSNEGDIVLDPFMWSGTTAVVCIETNRNFIGIEISQEYVDIANKRLQETQVWLF